MTLSLMVMLDEDSLICDFAETYGIFDYRSLPALLAATLAVGLRETSRIKRKISGMEMSFNDYLMVSIYDRLNWLCWAKSDNGVKGIDMPVRIMDLLFGNENKKVEEDEYMTFDSPDAYEQARAELIGG